MAVPSADRVEQALRKALQSCEQVRLAVLFGSQARGRARPDSDVDIFLALEPNRPDTRAPVTSAVIDAVGANVHVVYENEAPPLLRFQIARYGVPLRERTAAEWVRFKRQAMIDWWDWAPLAAMIDAASIERLREKVAHG